MEDTDKKYKIALGRHDFPISQRSTLYEIEKITPLPLPFDENEKIFNFTDDEGNLIGEPYSYNDWLKMITDISGVSEDLMGESVHKNID